jgi:hypothetical protein
LKLHDREGGEVLSNVGDKLGAGKGGGGRGAGVEFANEARHAYLTFLIRFIDLK